PLPPIPTCRSSDLPPLPTKLLCDLHHHRDPSCTYRVPLRLQPPVQVHGDSSADLGLPLPHKFGALALLAESEVLVGHYLSDCEAVVTRRHVDLTRSDLGSLVSPPPGLDRGR